MKRLLAVLVVLGFAAGVAMASDGPRAWGNKESTTTCSVTPAIAHEWLGLARGVHIKGVGYHIPQDVKLTDYLKFDLPVGWKFGSAGNSTKWYLFVNTTTTSGLYIMKSDTNGGGVDTWGYESGSNAQTLKFRVVDNEGLSYLETSNVWYISSKEVPQGGVNVDPKTWTVPVVVPACTAAGDLTECCDASCFFLTAWMEDAINLLNPQEYPNTRGKVGLLTVVNYFSIEYCCASDKIDAENLRVSFMDPGRIDQDRTPRYKSYSSMQLETCDVLEFSKPVFSARDFIMVTISGNFAGVKSVTWAGQKLLTFPGNVAAFKIYGDMVSSGCVIFEVDKSTALDTRCFTVTAELTGSDASSLCSGPVPVCAGDCVDYKECPVINSREKDENCQGLLCWTIDGVLFRSAAVYMAPDADAHTALRIANENDIPVEVWVEVWMDDGREATGVNAIHFPNPSTGTYPSIPKLVTRSWDFKTYVNPIIPLVGGDIGIGNKARVRVFVWAPRGDNVFGFMLYRNGMKHTEVPLEQFNFPFGWEK